MPAALKKPSTMQSAQWPVADAQTHAKADARASIKASTKPGSCWIPVDELLTARFLSRHTTHASFQALLGASGLSPERFSKLEEHSDSSWEAFIRRTSHFPNWNAMLCDARGEWIMRRLGLSIDA